MAEVVTGLRVRAPVLAPSLPVLKVEAGHALKVAVRGRQHGTECQGMGRDHHVIDVGSASRPVGGLLAGGRDCLRPTCLTAQWARDSERRRPLGFVEWPEGAVPHQSFVPTGSLSRCASDRAGAAATPVSRSRAKLRKVDVHSLSPGAIAHHQDIEEFRVCALDLLGIERERE